jgi:hypothetical protein
MKNIVFLYIVLAAGNAAQCQPDKTITQIELSKITRGYQEYIRITPDSVNVYVENSRSTDRPGAEYGRKLETDEWTRLIQSFEGVKLDDIPKLTSPGMKRAVDAAMHSTITVQTKDHKYAHGYDDEDAHKALQALRKEIREIGGRK